MPGKLRKSLRDKTLHNVLTSHLSETDKDCIVDVFIRYEHMLDNEKHGKWNIVNTNLFPVQQCSLCGCGMMLADWDYCPNCGAKMEVQNE